MKRFLLLLFSLLVMFNILLTGCSKVSEPKETERSRQKKVESLNPKDFFPLTEGSTWEYQGEGNEYASFNRKVVAVKGNLAQVREDNGGTVTASVFKSSSESVTQIFSVGEAYGDTNYLNSKPNKNVVILKKPLSVGTKWATPDGEKEIVEVNALVNTLAGIFKKCIKVKIAGKDSTVYEYFAKGVGMVEREFISGDTRIVSILKKYSIMGTETKSNKP